MWFLLIKIEFLFCYTVLFYTNIRILLVDGADRQVLPLSEAFVRLGCKVATLNSSKLDNGYVSKYPKEKILDKELKEDVQRLKDTLISLAKTDKYDLFVATSDTTAELLSTLKKEMSSFVRVAMVDPELFYLAYDKNETMRICMENNIPCPKTFFGPLIGRYKNHCFFGPEIGVKNCNI